MTRPLLLIGLLLAGIGSAGGDGDRPEAGAPAATGPLAVGDVARPWRLAEWSGSKPLDLEDLRGRVVVVRFWTDACPYCARSLPALQALAEEFRDRPVTFVGIYHAKPPGRERPWPAAVAWARRRGVSFPLAYDRGWATLRLLVAGGPRPGGDLGQLRHRPARASRARPPRPRVLPDGRPVPGPPGSGLPGALRRDPARPGSGVRATVLGLGIGHSLRRAVAVGGGRSGEPTWLEARVTIASGQGRAGAAGVVHARPSSFQRSARLRAWLWGKEAQASPSGEESSRTVPQRARRRTRLSLSSLKSGEGGFSRPVARLVMALHLTRKEEPP